MILANVFCMLALWAYGMSQAANPVEASCIFFGGLTLTAIVVYVSYLIEKDKENSP